jgi:hypothetical protein
MDRHFLEFWGNFMLNSARSQKQVEELTEWVRKGFSGFEELTSLFKNIYGLEETATGSTASVNAWKKAQEDFMKSMRDYLNLLGVVPFDEHAALVRKYEDLKEKIASQEETIRHLKMLLSESQGANAAEVTQHFDELIRKQSDQFQNLMDGFNRLFQKEQPSQESKLG